MQRNVVWLVVGLWALLCGRATGQNLIPNGNFEAYRNCPLLDNLLEEATPWSNPNRATPDFYHQCFPTNQIQLPPRSGQGLGRLFFAQRWAEYLAVPLTNPLVADECYYAEWYVATDTPNKYLLETIGAHFSAQPVQGGTTDLLGVTPQVLDRQPTGSMPLLQWQRIGGTFKAKGGERYATIGSFYKTPEFLSFYYLFVDDVSLVPVKLDLGRDTTLCGRNSTYLLNGTTPGATEYRWSDGSTKPTLLVTRPGKYQVTAVTPCKVLTDSITVTYALDFDLGRDTTLCRGQSLTLSVPASPLATYRWQDGSALRHFTVEQAGAYVVRVTQAGCVAADTIRVRYILPPVLDLGPDKALCGAEEHLIQPTVAEGRFSWLDKYELPQRKVNSSGVFRAQVQNDCAVVTDSIRVSYEACDCILYAPTGFTPNNDGLNDSFLVYGCGDITLTSLTIFNRWGEVVFQTGRAPFEWDGLLRGTACPAGVYTWSVQYELVQGERRIQSRKEGTLSLIR